MKGKVIETKASKEHGSIIWNNFISLSYLTHGMDIYVYYDVRGVISEIIKKCNIQ